jgi:hypothetical protein
MLLDTSGLLSYLDATDPQHATARRLFATSPARLSHSYVLAELVALATARRLPRQSILAFVARLQDSSNIHIVWVGEALHRDAFALLRERLDKTLFALRRGQFPPDGGARADGGADDGSSLRAGRLPAATGRVRQAAPP